MTALPIQTQVQHTTGPPTQGPHLVRALKPGNTSRPSITDLFTPNYPQRHVTGPHAQAATHPPLARFYALYRQATLRRPPRLGHVYGVEARHLLLGLRQVRQQRHVLREASHMGSDEKHPMASEACIYIYGRRPKQPRVMEGGAFLRMLPGHSPRSGGTATRWRRSPPT